MAQSSGSRLLYEYILFGRGQHALRKKPGPHVAPEIDTPEVATLDAEDMITLGVRQQVNGCTARNQPLQIGH